MRSFPLFSRLVFSIIGIVLAQYAIARAESVTIQDKASITPLHQLIASADHPLDSVPRMTLRMSYDPFTTAYPIIYLRINGSEPQPFLFDTGYTGTILIDEQAAKKLKVKISDSSSATVDANGVKKQLRKASVDSLEMVLSDGSSAPWSKPTIVIGSSLPIASEQFAETPAVGIVGIAAFLGPTLYLDFEKQSMDIIPGTHPDLATLGNSISASFTVDAEGVKADFSKILGVKQSLLVDTGAVSSSLSKELIEKSKPSLSFDSEGVSLNSKQPQKSYFLDTLLFDNKPVAHLLVSEAGNKGPILGMDILSRFRVTVDMRRKQLVLEPTRLLIEQNKLFPGYSGVVVERRGSDIVITHSINKYKEFVGSTIVAIDDVRFLGKNIKDLPVAQVQSVLDGYADTEVTMTVRSTGGEKKITIKRMTLQEALKTRNEVDRQL